MLTVALITYPYFFKVENRNGGGARSSNSFTKKIIIDIMMVSADQPDNYGITPSASFHVPML